MDPTSAIDELTIFAPPEPLVDIIDWPCLELSNVCIYVGNDSSNLADITEDVRNEESEALTVEGDIERVVTIAEPREFSSFTSIIYLGL